MNKVAVTGIGTINSIAKNVSEFSDSLKSMEIGIDYISQFDTERFSVKVAGEVKDFKPGKYIDERKVKRYDRYLQFALIAAKQAIEDAGLIDTEDWRENAGVTVSSGIGGFKTLHQQYINFFEKGPSAVRPFLIPMMIADMASGAVGLEFGLKGPNFGTVSACASSLHSIIVASMMVRHGYTDIVLAGGTEAVIDPMPVAGFANMTALSTRSDDPKKVCRPFDKSRNGFVMGEGAGVLVLESEERALKRGAKIYGYIQGFGMTEDAYHISATDPEGKGAAKAVEIAIKEAGIEKSQVELINCHATSTPVGDISEIRALKSVFGDKLDNIYLQSTKALTGHTLGAAGAIEMIASIVQSKNGFVHGMPNLENPEEECIPLKIPSKTEIAFPKTVLKNAFGFGGHNASIIYVRRD